MSRKVLVTMMIFVCSIMMERTYAHKGHDHDAEPSETVQPVVPKQNFEGIQASYLTRVKPLFQRACADCHSADTKYPWYASLPFVKQMIADDISEARSHLDISHDFPFVSHATPKEDLVAIAESIKSNDMPPLNYRIMHPSARLSPEEKAEILAWIEESLRDL